MNRLNEENLGTATDNPSMGNINNITASTQERKEWHRTIPQILRNTPQNVAADPVLHSTVPT